MRAEFMDRRLFLHLQGGRQISGVLRGYDMFLNLVVDSAFEELGGGQRKPCGMVVSITPENKASARMDGWMVGWMYEPGFQAGVVCLRGTVDYHK